MKLTEAGDGALQAANAFSRQVVDLIPIPSSLLLFSGASHEWIGMPYYRARGSV